MNRICQALCAAVFLAALVSSASSARAADPPATGPASAPVSADLLQGFANPPNSAKPRTWWHWTSGNVTKEGITKDLEWMNRVGIGGFQLVDVAFGSGQTVEPKIEFMSQPWLDAVRRSAVE